MGRGSRPVCGDEPPGWVHPERGAVVDQRRACPRGNHNGILADLVRNVGGNRVQVSSIVPDDADSHTYEPSLRNVRDVAYADLAFSNYLLLEEHNVIKALDANLREDATEVSIAEASPSMPPTSSPSSRTSPSIRSGSGSAWKAAAGLSARTGRQKSGSVPPVWTVPVQ